MKLYAGNNWITILCSLLKIVTHNSEQIPNVNYPVGEYAQI